MKETKQTLKWLLSFVSHVPFQVITAVVLGIVSYSCVIAIPIIGVTGFLGIESGNVSFKKIGLAMLLAVFLRGVARYGEQYMNHYIAFHTLADVRHVLFQKLRQLAPAKLLTRQKGDYIALVTSDVEMLEIFFAHTVSPVLIGSVMGIGLVGYFYSVQPLLGTLSVITYLLMGVCLPMIQYHRAKDVGDAYKAHLSDLNQTVIEASEGNKDVRQYQLFDGLKEVLHSRGHALNDASFDKSKQLRTIQIIMEVIVGVASFLFVWLSVSTDLPKQDALLSSVIFLSSFGPFIPLSMLGNELLSTFSSAKRLRHIMDEEPVVRELTGYEPFKKEAYEVFHGENISFGYDSQQLVLDNQSFQFPKTGLVGIQGVSGRGKSTLLHLMLRFWDVSSGEIRLNQHSLNDINTSDLRQIEGFMSQSTDLFTGTIRENVGIGQKEATDEMIQLACQKASIHEWIMNLPDGYDTMIKTGERDLSDGEKQRLGLARLFLHDAPILLLDEPTSNLDYVNEQVILQALEKEKAHRLIVIVSHRETTLKQADHMMYL